MTCKAESRITSPDPPPNSRFPATRSGFSPTKLSSNVLNEFVGEDTVRDPIDRLAGKFSAVSRRIPSAFQPAFVNITPSWLESGIAPSDQYGSSQYPLVVLIQLFGCAGALATAPSKIAAPISPRT